MLRSTIANGCLYLTADLQATDVLKKPVVERSQSSRFTPELKRFPPVDDVLAAVDRIASRVFAA